MRRCLQSAQRHVVCMRSIHRPPVKLFLNSLYKTNAATHISQAATMSMYSSARGTLQTSPCGILSLKGRF